jgi:hypothetical protein
MKITRSFTKRIQLRQFEPIESTCAIEYETENENIVALTESSELFDKFCRSEVEKTLASLKITPLDKAKNKDVGMLDTIEDLSPGIDDLG